MENVTNIFKTLSDKTRLRIINLLNSEELSVHEIVEIIGGAQSGISRHLAVLKNAGFIIDRKEGTWSYYKFNTEISGFLKEIFHSIREKFKEDNELKLDLKKLKQVIENRREVSKVFFEKSAGIYDDLAQDFASERLNLYSLINVIPEKLKVIDVGCGTGNFLPFLMKINASITAVDSSPAMLEKAKKKTSEYENIDFYICEADSIPLDNNTTDVCFLNMVLHHAPKPDEVFKEIYRLLKNKGVVIVTDFIEHSDETMRGKYGDLWLGFNFDNIKSMMNKIGFKNLSYNTFEVGNKESFIVKGLKD